MKTNNNAEYDKILEANELEAAAGGKRPTPSTINNEDDNIPEVDYDSFFNSGVCPVCNVQIFNPRHMLVTANLDMYKEFVVHYHLITHGPYKRKK